VLTHDDKIGQMCQSRTVRLNLVAHLIKDQLTLSLETILHGRGHELTLDVLELPDRRGQVSEVLAISFVGDICPLSQNWIHPLVVLGWILVEAWRVGALV
jgi:hypothetical protein